MVPYAGHRKLELAPAFCCGFRFQNHAREATYDRSAQDCEGEFHSSSPWLWPARCRQQGRVPMQVLMIRFRSADDDYMRWLGCKASLEDPVSMSSFRISIQSRRELQAARYSLKRLQRVRELPHSNGHIVWCRWPRESLSYEINCIVCPAVHCYSQRMLACSFQRCYRNVST